MRFKSGDNGNEIINMNNPKQWVFKKSLCATTGLIYMGIWANHNMGYPSPRIKQALKSLYEKINAELQKKVRKLTFKSEYVQPLHC